MSFIQKVILITIFKEVNLTTDKLKRENGNLTSLPNVSHFTLPGILVHKFSLNIIVSEKKKGRSIIYNTKLWKFSQNKRL